ncbi:MAG: PEP/pyruvate-binding domain-containing protein [Verrucomicrobiota bacterium]
MKIRFPEEISGDHPLGGKAAALVALAQSGLSIPPWFVVLEGREEVGLPEALARLGGEVFAVRSSAGDEDGASDSFAGQFDSFLNAPPERVAERIEAVRASGRAARVALYRESRGREEPRSMAVLVQRMIQAEKAGVAFSADPLSGRRSLVRLSAVRGLGEALVSGEAEGEDWQVAEEAERVAGPDVLREHEAMQVADLARACEQFFGVPQDIEWAFDAAGKLWLLQSRPITTLGQLPDPEDTLRVWDNSNIAESYSGITTPLTYSFARKAYAEVYRAFCRILQVPKRRIFRSEAVFEEMIGQVRGRVYYNLLSWYRVLALLPGFSLNRGFMEQMMGVREPLPEELVEKVMVEAKTHPVADALALGRTLAGVVWGQFTLRGRIRAFYRRLNRALAPCDPGAMRGEELAAAYRDLEKRLLTRWDAPLVNDFLAMIAYGVLKGLAKKWAKDAGGDYANRLVSRVGGVVSAEPARRMREMAAMIEEETARFLIDSEQPWQRREARLRELEEVGKAYQAYLDRFGDRCLEELKLESRNLRDDPSTLLAGIGALALSPREPSAEESLEERRIENPFGRWIFRRVAEWAVARVRDRENLRFERTRVFGRVRDLARAMGRRLAADGRLADAEDVFFLEMEEVVGVFEARRAGDDLRGMAEERKRLFREYREQPTPPDRFETRGPLWRNALQAELTHKVLEGDLRGTGASPGVVRGKVRVVENPQGVTLRAGEILVARQTDPGWIVLFTAAAGLLVERGSVLSHSAIVSRELGLPCVVGLTGICEALQEGDEVELDGASGVVRRFPS